MQLCNLFSFLEGLKGLEGNVGENRQLGRRSFIQQNLTTVLCMSGCASLVSGCSENTGSPLKFEPINYQHFSRPELKEFFGNMNDVVENAMSVYVHNNENSSPAERINMRIRIIRDAILEKYNDLFDQAYAYMKDNFKVSEYDAIDVISLLAIANGFFFNIHDGATFYRFEEFSDTSIKAKAHRFVQTAVRNLGWLENEIPQSPLSVSQINGQNALNDRGTLGMTRFGHIIIYPDKIRALSSKITGMNDPRVAQDLLIGVLVNEYLHGCMRPQFSSQIRYNETISIFSLKEFIEENEIGNMPMPEGIMLKEINEFLSDYASLLVNERMFFALSLAYFSLFGVIQDNTGPAYRLCMRAAGAALQKYCDYLQKNAKDGSEPIEVTEKKFQEVRKIKAKINSIVLGGNRSNKRISTQEIYEAYVAYYKFTQQLDDKDIDVIMLFFRNLGVALMAKVRQKLT